MRISDWSSDVCSSDLTEARSLAEVIPDADIFLGLSAPGVLKPEMVARMAARPLILALANPTPEILPEEARADRKSGVKGKSVSVRVDLGVRRIIEKQNDDVSYCNYG